MPTPTDVFGSIKSPPGVEYFDQQAGGGAAGGAIGLLLFFSRALQIVTLISGIWVFVQIILAGYDYVSSNGDTAAHNRVKDRVTMSVIGLTIIVASYGIAALIGLLLFNDPTFILQPKLEQAK